MSLDQLNPMINHFFIRALLGKWVVRMVKEKVLIDPQHKTAIFAFAHMSCVRQKRTVFLDQCHVSAGQFTKDHYLL